VLIEGASWLCTANEELRNFHVKPSTHGIYFYMNIWGPWPDFYYCQTVAGLFIWGTVSDERTGL
jgi:hypothetical protein